MRYLLGRCLHLLRYPWSIQRPSYITPLCFLWLKPTHSSITPCRSYFLDFQICVIGGLFSRLAFPRQPILGYNMSRQLPFSRPLPLQASCKAGTWYNRWSCHCSYLIATAGFGLSEQISHYWLPKAIWYNSMKNRIGIDYNRNYILWRINSLLWTLDEIQKHSLRKYIFW